MARARAAALGAVAWIVGYVVAIGYAVVIGGEDATLPDTGEFAFADVTGPSGAEAVWKWGGNMFYSAHFVPTEVGVEASNLGGFGAASGSVSIGFNLIPNTVPGQGGKWLLLLAVPPLALIGAGWLAARWAQTGPADATSVGASVTLGYLPLSVAGIFLFEITYAANSAEYGEVAVSVGPSLLLGVLLAGVVYPAAFGALGGYLWVRRTRETRPSAGTGPAPPR